MGEDVTCPECAETVPRGTSFCPACGGPLGQPAADAEDPVVEYLRSEPRLFGVLPVTFTVALTAALCLLGVVALAVGFWLIGIVLIGIAAPLALVALAVLRKDPGARVVRATRAGASHTRAWAGFAGGSLGAWAEAGRDVLWLRTKLRSLRAERRRLQFALGDAAFRGAQKETAELRECMRGLDEAIAGCRREAVSAKNRARRRVERRRHALRTTQQLR